MSNFLVCEFDLYHIHAAAAAATCGAGSTHLVTEGVTNLSSNLQVDNRSVLPHLSQFPACGSVPLAIHGDRCGPNHRLLQGYREGRQQ